MIRLNPYKPLYIDKENKIIRMGNFKTNGKEIFFENNKIIDIFENLRYPISRKDLVDKIYAKHNIKKEEIENAVDYLQKERFIINEDDYQLVIENNKYNRQNLYFEMFDNYYNSIEEYKNKKILILGLGGIGSNVGLMLSRAGFKNFTLVDCDIVEESNLIRQLPYTYDDIGKYKTEALYNKMISNNCIIEQKVIKIKQEEDILNEIKKSDIVLCTLDRPLRVIRRLINNICINENKPLLFAGFSEHVGMVGPFILPRKTACLICNEKNLTEIPMNNVKIIPSYGPLCSFISSIVTNEIINHFIKFNKQNLYGKTLMFDFSSYNQEIIKWRINNNCQVCGCNDN